MTNKPSPFPIPHTLSEKFLDATLSIVVNQLDRIVNFTEVSIFAAKYGKRFGVEKLLEEIGVMGTIHSRHGQGRTRESAHQDMRRAEWCQSPDPVSRLLYQKEILEYEKPFFEAIFFVIGDITTVNFKIDRNYFICYQFRFEETS